MMNHDAFMLAVRQRRIGAFRAWYTATRPGLTLGSLVAATVVGQ